MRVAVVGLGYVGLVTATCLARLGQDVDGIESDGSKLEALKAGRVPYFEPHLASELEVQRAAGRLRFTDDAAALANVDVILICVGTPSDADGRADLRHVLQVADAIAEQVQGSPVVALRSTVPIGTTRRVERRLNDALAARGLGPLTVFANPEFLRTGRAIDDFLRPTRVVIGRTEAARDADVETLTTLYAPLMAPTVVTDAESAEMVKNASNAFLAMRISFVNEIAALCEAAGASVDDVVAAMAFDPRIGGEFMRPGPGYGGSCLPKDVRSLIATGADHGVEMRVARATNEVNREQAIRAVDRLAAALDGPLSGSRVAVLGLAFKPDTDDTRESPGLAVAAALNARGVAVVAADPEAAAKVVHAEPWLEVAEDALAAADGADAVILATEWPAYVTMDLERLAQAMRGRVLFDARNALDPAKAMAAGLEYLGVGRGREANGGSSRTRLQAVGSSG